LFGTPAQNGLEYPDISGHTGSRSAPVELSLEPVDKLRFGWHSAIDQAKVLVDSAANGEHIGAMGLR